MGVITKIAITRRRATRRSVHLDGRFAFACHVNVVARFRLREGLTLSADQLREIERGEVRQECLDAALRLLSRRLQSNAEIRRKLLRRDFTAGVIDEVIVDLTRMGYLDDERFARARAASAADRKQYGRRRAQIELLKAGVSRQTAASALEHVYSSRDSLACARELLKKRMPRLRTLDPAVGRRRAMGLLLRRGFELDDVQLIVNECFARGSRDA